MYWYGGILRSVAVPVSLYSGLVVVLYVAQVEIDAYLSIERDGLRTLGSFVTFLLVFRMNQSMGRQNLCMRLTASLFSLLESLVMMVCSCIKGAKDDPRADTDKDQRDRELALAARVNLVRLSLAVGVSVILHCSLLDAASNGGALSTTALSHVVFLYSRLQALLYPEEMELLDRALCVTREEGEDEDEAFTQVCSNYRVEVCRHFHGDPNLGERLFNHDPPPEEAALGQTFAPLPKLVVMILYDSLLRPIGHSWGCPERMMNVCAKNLQQILHDFGDLTMLILVPLPLAYQQLCRVLLVIFAVTYPLSVSPDEGPTDNIFLPLFIMVAMLGLEYLGDMLENPLGYDESDLDLLSMLHSLEVSCEYAFEFSESSRPRLRHALGRPLEEIRNSNARMNCETAGAACSTSESCAAPQNHRFQSFFRWVPLPAPILGHSIENHGHADAVHETNLGSASFRSSVRNMMQRRPVRADGYRRVAEDAETIGGGPSQAGSRTGGFRSSVFGWLQESLFKHTQDSLYRDPLVYCHYLVCIGPLRVLQEEQARGGAPRRGDTLRTVKLLKDQDAATMVFPASHREFKTHSRHSFDLESDLWDVRIATTAPDSNSPPNATSLVQDNDGSAMAAHSAERSVTQNGAHRHSAADSRNSGSTGRCDEIRVPLTEAGGGVAPPCAPDREHGASNSEVAGLETGANCGAASINDISSTYLSGVSNEPDTAAFIPIDGPHTTDEDVIALEIGGQCQASFGHIGAPAPSAPELPAAAA